MCVQVHEGPKGNPRVEMGAVPFPPLPVFFIGNVYVHLSLEMLKVPVGYLASFFL